MTDSIKKSLSEIKAMEEARIADAEASQKAFRAAVEAQQVRVELEEQERLRQIALAEKDAQAREIERLRLVAKIESHREKNHLKTIDDLTSKVHDQRLQLAVMDNAPPKSPSYAFPVFLAILVGFVSAGVGAQVQLRVDQDKIARTANYYQGELRTMSLELDTALSKVSQLQHKLDSYDASCEYPHPAQPSKPTPKAISKSAPKPAAPCVCKPGDPLCSCL